MARSGSAAEAWAARLARVGLPVLFLQAGALLAGAAWFAFIGGREQHLGLTSAVAGMGGFILGAVGTLLLFLGLVIRASVVPKRSQPASDGSVVAGRLGIPPGIAVVLASPLSLGVLGLFVSVMSLDVHPLMLGFCGIVALHRRRWVFWSLAFAGGVLVVMALPFAVGSAVGGHELALSLVIGLASVAQLLALARSDSRRWFGLGDGLRG